MELQEFELTIRAVGDAIRAVGDTIRATNSF
jgi:hypothetical protein